MGRLSQYQTRNTFQFHLPAPYEGEWIKMRQETPMGDLLALMSLDEGDPVATLGVVVDVMPRLIVDWSFTDDADQPLAINEESVRQVPVNLWAAITEALLEGLVSINPKALALARGE